MEWISVEDRLPELNSKVLAFSVPLYRIRGEKTEMIVAEYVMFEDGPDFGVYDDDCCCEYHVDCVTHWMPLPSPPKMDLHAENGRG